MDKVLSGRKTYERREVVYQFIDGDGKVLYVGVSGSVLGRMQSHAQKPWFDQVRTIKLEPYDDARISGKAEMDLIRKLKPPYNLAPFKMGRPKKPKVVDEKAKSIWLDKETYSTNAEALKAMGPGWSAYKARKAFGESKRDRGRPKNETEK